MAVAVAASDRKITLCSHCAMSLITIKHNYANSVQPHASVQLAQVQEACQNTCILCGNAGLKLNPQVLCRREEGPSGLKKRQHQVLLRNQDDKWSRYGTPRVKIPCGSSTTATAKANNRKRAGTLRKNSALVGESLALIRQTLKLL